MVHSTGGSLVGVRGVTGEGDESLRDRGLTSLLSLRSFYNDDRVVFVGLVEEDKKPGHLKLVRYRD